MRTALAALAACLLTACATPSPVAPIVLPCPAATDLPAPPARTLHTDPAAPGATVRAAILNRAAWIAHADELTARLISCQP